MKTAIIWIVLALFAGLTVYNTFSLGRVRNTQEEVAQQPVVDEPYQPVPPTERLVETTGFDYSDNFVVGNLLQFTPVTPDYTLGLGRDIGQIFYDNVNSQLRFRDGNTSGGVQVAFAKYGTETIYIRTAANDTIDFPALFGDHAIVNYSVEIDSVNGTTAGLSFETTDNIDSTFLSLNSSLYPYTLVDGESPKFVNTLTLKYNRALVAIGDADTISMTITRTFDLGQ